MTNMTGLNTALTGIRAAQAGLDTSSHNIANANSTGYTRQRVTQTSTLPFRSPQGPIGTGTAVSIGRTRDAFLDSRARAASAAVGWSSARADLLQRTEAVLAEPDDGVSTQLGALWDAFEDLAAAPNDLAARQRVLTSLAATAGRVRTISGQWDQLAADTRAEAELGLSRANELFAELAELNRVIPSSNPLRGTSSDLLDARDRIVDELAHTLGATATAEPDGTVTLSIRGTVVVEGVTATTLEMDPATGDVTTADGTLLEPGGRIGGLQQFLQSELPRWRGALDELVVTLADALNEQHRLGLRPDGANGGDLLAYDPADPMRTLTVALAGADELAAASDANAPAAPAAHDGTNASALAALRSRVPAGGTRTIDDSLRSVVIELASAAASAKRSDEAQDSLHLASTLARQSAHGISLDEEMVDLVKYQRALDAASRIMTALDEALDRLVNRTGRVGL